MKFTILSLSLLITFLFIANAFSQDFGDINEADLAMTSVAEDPEADVVILFNKAQMGITPDFNLEMDVHVRIKILTEAGKEWANVDIGYWHEDKIFNLEAQSYLPNGDEFELDDDEIFEENIMNYKYYKFAIPGVEIGSVIEYKYSLFSDYITNLEPWYFQSKEFTKLSEISVLLPKGFNYSVLKKNWTFYDVKQTQEEIWNPYKSGKKIARYIWTGKNMPAIRKEPNMNSFKDYYAQILFQLVSFKNEYFSHTFAKTWNDIAENNYKTFEVRINSGGDQADFVDTYLSGITDPLVQAEKIYKYVRSEIETESGSSWYPKKEPEEVFEDKKGKPSEKNTLLLNMLNHIGLKAEPLLISTKSNGEIFRKWAQLQQFSRTIVCLTLNKKKYFLDSSNKFCPFGSLTPNCNVGIGLLLQEEEGEIVKINPAKSKNKTEIVTNASLKDDGTMIAESNIIFNGYRAVLERNNIFNTEDLSKFIENKIDDFNVEAEIDTFYYSELDSIEKPLLLTIKYKLPAYCEETSGLMYFTPPFITLFKNNPYKKDRRDFPIDYQYAYDARETINLKIPDGYKILEKPKTKKAVMSKFNFTKIFFGSENELECKRNYSRKKTHFSVAEYSKLKAVFDKIVESDQDLVVLKKK